MLFKGHLTNVQVVPEQITPKQFSHGRNNLPLKGNPIIYQDPTRGRDGSSKAVINCSRLLMAWVLKSPLLSDHLGVISKIYAIILVALLLTINLTISDEVM